MMYNDQSCQTDARIFRADTAVSEWRSSFCIRTTSIQYRSSMKFHTEQDEHKTVLNGFRQAFKMDRMDQKVWEKIKNWNAWIGHHSKGRGKSGFQPKCEPKSKTHTTIAGIVASRASRHICQWIAWIMLGCFLQSLTYSDELMIYVVLKFIQQECLYPGKEHQTSNWKKGVSFGQGWCFVANLEAIKQCLHVWRFWGIPLL